MKIRLEHIGDRADPRNKTKAVDWPAVPRVGEFIEMRVQGEELYTGTVRIVLWGDDGIPVVRFR